MNLVDTSVWVDYLRGAGTAAHLEFGTLRDEDLPSIATCAPIRMELRLTPDDLARARLEVALDGLVQIPMEPEDDFALAADIYRAVRRTGHTVRSMNDCLIAAIAHRSGAVLWHCDIDYDRIGAVLPDLRSRSLL